MRYRWRVDHDTRLIVVQTEGEPDEWVPVTNTPAGVYRVADQWEAMATPIAERHGLQVEGVLAQVKQESDGYPRAIRHEPNGWTGVGLLQLTHPSIKAGHSDEQLFDPALNLEIGTAHIAQLARSYRTPDGLPDWPRVFASFNAGSPRPNAGSPWNLFCTGNHVQNEVENYNVLVMRRLTAAQQMAAAALARIDLASMADLTPHRA